MTIKNDTSTGHCSVCWDQDTIIAHNIMASPLPQGYLPANIDRREETLQRKRQEYQNFIDQYYHTRTDPLHIDTFRQVEDS